MIFTPPPAKYLEPNNAGICDRVIWMNFLYGPRVKWKDKLVEEYLTYSADEYDRKPLTRAERTMCRHIDKFEAELMSTIQVIRDYQDDDGLDNNRVKFYANVGKSRYLNELYFAKYYKKSRSHSKNLAALSKQK